MNKTTRKAITAGVLGNAIEWYDFALYGHFSVIIGQTFFPKEEPQLAMLAAFAVFSVSFFMRPLGAVFFSLIGDRYGRKRALALSLLVLAIPTAGIGLLPSYSSWGIAATVTLVLLRLFQGLSVGGEMGGAVTYVMEHTPSRQIGLASSLIQSSTCLGLLFGTVVSSALSWFIGQEAFENYGWRLPFVFGIGAAWIGFEIRRHMPESVLYEEARKENRLLKNPVKVAICEHPMEILKGVGILMPMTSGFFFTYVYFNSFMMTSLKFPATEALFITSIGLVIGLLTTIGGGWLADRWGFRRVLLIGVFTLMITLFPILSTFSGTTNPIAIMVAFFMLSVALGIYTSSVFGTVSGLFGTEIRYSGVSLAVNLSSPIFGSTAPLLAAWLINHFGVTTGFTYFGFYMTGLCLLAFLAIKRIRSQNFQEWKKIG